jgi:SAM-dependent methyltransferase
VASSQRESSDETTRLPTPDTRLPNLDSYKYVGFEDQFRGSPQEIRERVAAYVPLFEGAGDVLDVGCGRGEFLDLLRERGISARGVDINDDMAAICRERGLDATSGDALRYLLAQRDASLGGLFAAQVVEHLEPDYLMRLLDVAYHKLRPGSRIILETINTACWYAFFASYLRDLTHVRPLHPETLQYLAVASGFQRVEIRYSAPFPDESKLQPIPIGTALGGGRGHDGRPAVGDGGGVQRERQKAERAAVHLSRLCRDRRAPVTKLRLKPPRDELAGQDGEPSLLEAGS